MSSLNLEPNPFEQSFAHTGKLTQDDKVISTTSATALNENISNNSQAIEGSKPSTNQSGSSQLPQQTQIIGKASPYSALQSPPPLSEKQPTLSISQLTSNNRVSSSANNVNDLSSTNYIATSTDNNHNNNSTSTNNDSLNSNNFTMNRPSMLGPTVSSSFIYPIARPNIQTPGALTPGGSKKLPPLVLSPNFLPSNADESITNVTNTNINAANNVNIPNNANANSYFSYIPRTGLTPNESNMRTGLTPGSVYPLFQTIRLNNSNNNNTLNSTNATIQSTTNIPINYKSSITPGIPNSSSIRTLNSNAINDYTKIPNNVRGFSPSPGVFGMPLSLTTEMNTNIPFDGATTSINKNSNYNDRINKYGSNSLINEQKNNYADSKNINEPNNKRRNSSTSDTSKKTTSSKISQKTTVRSRKRKNSSTVKENQDSTEPKSKSVKSINNENMNPKPIEENQTSQEYLDEKERKRREFLERNRLAASKFRKRKKEYIQRIENDFRNLQIEYDNMRSVLDALCSFNSYRHTTSMLSRLRFHLEQNYVLEAINDLNEIESLVQNIEYYKRGGLSVLALNNNIPSTAPTDSRDSSTNKSSQPVNPSTSLPTDLNGNDNSSNAQR